MLSGLFLGFIVGIIVALLVIMATDTQESKVPIITLIICLILGGLIGHSENNNEYRVFIAQHMTTRNSYETSLNDERLTGFERVELVRMANEADVQLASRKIQVNRWYNFDISSDIKTQIAEIEPIVSDINQ